MDWDAQFDYYNRAWGQPNSPYAGGADLGPALNNFAGVSPATPTNAIDWNAQLRGFDLGAYGNLADPTKVQKAGGSPTSILDSASSVVSGFKIPSFNDVVTGMMNGPNGTKGGSGLGDTIDNYFIRGTVIILGFIFVAVGLAMFRVPATIIRDAIPKAAGGNG